MIIANELTNLFYLERKVFSQTYSGRNVKYQSENDSVRPMEEELSREQKDNRHSKSYMQVDKIYSIYKPHGVHDKIYQYEEGKGIKINSLV